MLNLKPFVRIVSADKDVITLPFANEHNSKLMADVTDFFKSADNGTEFCDCFFCTKDLSEEQLMYVLKEIDF